MFQDTRRGQSNSYTQNDTRQEVQLKENAERETRQTIERTKDTLAAQSRQFEEQSAGKIKDILEANRGGIAGEKVAQAAKASVMPGVDYELSKASQFESLSMYLADSERARVRQEVLALIDKESRGIEARNERKERDLLRPKATEEKEALSFFALKSEKPGQELGRADTRELAKNISRVERNMFSPELKESERRPSLLNKQKIEQELDGSNKRGSAKDDAKPILRKRKESGSTLE